MASLIRQVERRNWKALQKTGEIHIDGVDITIRKRGVQRIIDDIARVPLFGEAIELILTPALRKTMKLGKDASTTDAMKAAFFQAVEESGLDAGKELRRVITAIPQVFADVLTEDVVLADEDERPEFREWLGTLGLSGVLDAFVGWAGVNLPEVKDPLVNGAAWLLGEADAMLKEITGAGGRGQPTSATAAAPAEATTETAAA